MWRDDKMKTTLFAFGCALLLSTWAHAAATQTKPKVDTEIETEAETPADPSNTFQFGAQSGTSQYRTYTADLSLGLNPSNTFKMSGNVSESLTASSYGAGALGFDFKASDSFSWSPEAKMRVEPGDILGPGLALSFDRKLGNYFGEDLDTRLTFGIEGTAFFAKQASIKKLRRAVVQNTLSIGLKQELTSSLTVSASFDKSLYSSNAKALSSVVQNRLVSNPQTSGLVSGFTSSSFSTHVDWQINDSWDVGVSASRSIQVIDDSKNIGVGASIEYEFSRTWTVEGGWSRSKPQAGSIATDLISGELKYSW